MMKTRLIVIFCITVRLALFLSAGSIPVFAQGTDFFGFPKKKEPPPQEKPLPPPPKPKPLPKPKPKLPPKQLPKTQPQKSISDVLFLLDTSGSMDAPASGEKISKLDAAKQALNYFAKNMDSGTRFQLWSFNARLTQHPNSPNLKPKPKKVVFEPIGSSGSPVRQHLLGIIKNLETRGGTNLYQSLYKALYYFQSSAYQVPKGSVRHKLIVVLADGQDDGYSAIKLHHILAEKKNLPDIRLRTIGFGIRKNDPLHQILCRIASSPQGCTFVSDSKTLQAVVRTFTRY